jgi:transcriptional regulator with XRE-family HTH domain
MSEKSFAALFEAAERHDEYWTERAIIKFTEDLSLWMESKKISQADLAAAMGVSQPYISKILKGNVNFTLATMTKLARVLGAEVHVRLAPIGSQDGITGDQGHLQPDAASR